VATQPRKIQQIVTQPDPIHGWTRPMSMSGCYPNTDENWTRRPRFFCCRTVHIPSHDSSFDSRAAYNSTNTWNHICSSWRLTNYYRASAPLMVLCGDYLYYSISIRFRFDGYWITAHQRWL